MVEPFGLVSKQPHRMLQLHNSPIEPVASIMSSECINLVDLVLSVRWTQFYRVLQLKKGVQILSPNLSISHELISRQGPSGLFLVTHLLFVRQACWFQFLGSHLGFIKAVRKGSSLEQTTVSLIVTALEMLLLSFSVVFIGFAIWSNF